VRYRSTQDVDTWSLAMTWADKHVDSGVSLGLETADVIKLSTKQHVFESKRRRLQRRTRRHLKGRMLSVPPNSAAEATTMSVTDYQSKHLLSPKVSDLNRYKCYIRSLDPILGPWLAVPRIGNVQRGKFKVYINRDKSLDGLCRRIVGEGKARRRNQS